MKAPEFEGRLHAKTPQYQKHVHEAKQAIEKALQTGRTFYASCSFGKDSAVMLRLILDVRPDMPILYMSSGYALPDTIAYKDLLKEAWHLNLTELPAKVDYLELCQEFDLPHRRSQATQKRVVKMIKKDHASAWAKEQGFTGAFLGLRAEESRGRKIQYLRNPEGILDKENNILKVAPLATWIAYDIWAFTFSTGMPYNHLYDKENCGFTRYTLRNTGWLSTDGENQGRLEWLRKNYPQYYQKVRDLSYELQSDFPT